MIEFLRQLVIARAFERYLSPEASRCRCGEPSPLAVLTHGTIVDLASREEFSILWRRISPGGDLR